MSDQKPYPSRVLAVEMADEYLASHRKSETWRLIDMLRDELVRGGVDLARVKRDAGRAALIDAQKAFFPEDSIEWAREAHSSYVTYPGILSTLDSLIEDLGDEEETP